MGNGADLLYSTNDIIAERTGDELRAWLDQCYVDAGAFQILGAGRAAETAADDDHVRAHVAVFGGVRHAGKPEQTKCRRGAGTAGEFQEISACDVAHVRPPYLKLLMYLAIAAISASE